MVKSFYESYIFNNKNKGFLLIELLIAILTFSIISLTTVSFYVYIQQLTLQANKKIEAINIASNIIEKLLSNINSSLLQKYKQEKYIINIQKYLNMKGKNKNYILYNVTISWQHNKKIESITFITGTLTK